MIVQSMTLQEIHQELFSDLPTIHSQINFQLKDFKRRVLKASRYPYSHSYDCYTSKKKNLFTLTTLKRGTRDKPFVDGGNGGLLAQLQMKNLSRCTITSKS